MHLYHILYLLYSLLAGSYASPTINTNPDPNHPTATLTLTPSSNTNSPPEETTIVALIRGRHLPEFNQDIFLGVPYADKPPRFRPSTLTLNYSTYSLSKSLCTDQLRGGDDEGSEVVVDATTYGLDCPAYGSDTDELVAKGLIRLGEDCLNLNIVRPHFNFSGEGHHQDGEEDNENGLLPVLVWIYGGGWQQGATADPRYNMSYIIQQSAVSGNPVLGVSINYRTAAFGFLDSEEVRATGNTNLGLRDQRVALKWVKRNIQAFGGDPLKVTIWGESAGAYSVGDHLVADDGDNEGLFRAAIMESGNAVGPPYNGTSWHQPMYDRLVARANCRSAADSLECLRSLPYETLYSVAYEGLEWFAVVDGNFIPREPQVSYVQGKIAKVPILLGTNTDEGTSFGTTGVDTSAECVEALISSKRWVLTREQASTLLEYYPDNPALGCPYGWGNTTWPELGLMYKRYESMAGDITMVGPRRLLAQTMAGCNKSVYSYRWDVPALNSTDLIGVQHYAEIPFVFSNPVQQITPLGTDPSRLQLGQLAARMWTSFATHLDPNEHALSDIPPWPKYSALQEPENFVFRLPRNESHIEDDTYRHEGMGYINSIPR